jgi:hypothetical protein
MFTKVVTSWFIFRSSATHACENGDLEQDNIEAKGDLEIGLIFKNLNINFSSKCHTVNWK